MKSTHSPLVKNKGQKAASKNATSDFLMQRLTALALIPLVIWFCFSITLLPQVSHEVLLNWLKAPFNTIMMLLIIVISFKHAQMGMQVIFEDYISNLKHRNMAIFAVKLLSYLSMAIGVLSLLKIVVGGQ
jgi:succinate dehydrogenase / fumarate reductase membrane anchor subunit